MTGAGTTPLVIAATASGSGKTTVATGIMGALKRRGLSVAPFKVGPDYIDPGFHRAACGADSRNLDTWLTAPAIAKSVYGQAAACADIAVIEGVMGLFDGRAGMPEGDDSGSTAEIARILEGSVILVVDCARMARSLAPLLSGFAAFDGHVRIEGAVLNNAGSAGHGRMLQSAAAEAGVPVVGVLPRNQDIGLPSRHLGLVPVEEAEMLTERVERLADYMEEYLDLDSLMSSIARAATAAGGPPEQMTAPPPPAADRVRLAVARDEAFSFYYPDSLEALEEAGATLVNFSPLQDEKLPPCDGVLLGGGFPEVFARELEANTSMHASVAGAHARGIPIYAECGGMVYLCQTVEVDSRLRRMAGVIPATARMNSSRQALGYVEARALQGNILLRPGESIRGHEFHWSSVDWPGEGAAYEISTARGGPGTAQGFTEGNLLASFVHVNFRGNPAAARRFIAACKGSPEVRAVAAE